MCGSVLALAGAAVQGIGAIAGANSEANAKEAQDYEQHRSPRKCSLEEAEQLCLTLTP